MDLGLDGKRAYVMAASSGLGRAVATELVREGATVVISSRDETRLRTAAESIREEVECDDAIEWVVCDLTDEESVRTATETAIDRLGGLDVLVTNHGGPSTDPFSETSLSAFDEAYRGILRSTILTCEIALPALRDGGGAITNLVAASALEPSASGALGNVFRPGIYGLSKVLAEEFGADDVRVNCVSPRGVMSDRIRYKLSELAEREGTSETAAKERRTDELPLSDLGTPESFARAVAYISSPAAAYITGASLPVDGGWHRHAF
ncbi:short-chain dehydrogenase/reductase SDR [Haladaptatus paucihalophilus DX253]|uniref:3-oxoacyl-[acyl-carrier protein] reductase n=1 Tax=Haladaptatus paucihalophilus DX253 TaxID=797209 RepID=E7QVB7_HALPU|nr:SDR family oxidoreductase [Haladaptatus paucihalophilus]EFW91635.1 short-chain dehydrogenase/reductase SDR [Haladaptatus paucihalophilus DX253]SHL22318.1 3-oxoacyl-[acyl-carrier protein] reductase [Haladaptatus paucihalophilus DX253]